MTSISAARRPTDSDLIRTSVWVLVAAGMVILALATGAVDSKLSGVSAVGLLLSAVALWLARRVATRRLSVLYLVSVLWIIYFPIRLLAVQANRNYYTLHPVVRAATDQDFIWVWVVSVGGLLALVAGAWLATQVRVTPMRRWQDRPGYFQAVAMIGLAWLLLTHLVRVNSGLLTNVGPLLLFGIAGLAFIDARRERFGATTIALVLAGIALGATVSFKEVATLPVLSWALGSIAGRARRPSAWVVALGLVLGMVGFLGVAGQRIDNDTGHSANVATEAWRALFVYDLRTGTVGTHKKHGTEVLTNLGEGLSRRMSGVESLLLFRNGVPSQVPYARGHSIVDPLLSIVPGIKRFVSSSEYSQLSLGRWFQQRLYSLRPLQDSSSQAVTWPGDLYLNFGNAGIFLGLTVLGLLIGVFDRRFPTTTGFGCAVVAYVGTALLGIERNVAYAFATGAIRIAIVLVLALLFARQRVVASQAPS